MVSAIQGSSNEVYSLLCMDLDQRLAQQRAVSHLGALLVLALRLVCRGRNRGAGLLCCEAGGQAK